jgi:uncharacterized GH25 family protein
MQEDELDPAPPPSQDQTSRNSESEGNALGIHRGSSNPRPGAQPAPVPEEAMPEKLDAPLDAPEQPVENQSAKRAKRPKGKGVIKGTVTWHGDGAPVAGARIYLDYLERASNHEPYPEERMEWGTETDSDGKFRIGNLPVNIVFGKRGGRFAVIAEKDGASAVATAGMTDDELLEIVELELRPTAGIAGRVLDQDGEPVTGAVVTPQEITDKAQQRQSYGARSLWARTDGNGNFALAHLLKGSWKLAAKARGYAATVSDPIETGDRDARIVLKKGTSLSGRVISAKDGEPVDNVFVTVNDQRNSSNQLRAGTDDSGVFQVTALADGEYLLQLDDKEHVLMGEAPRIVVADAQPIDGVTLTVAYGGAITGHISDAETGAPIGGVRIQARGTQRRSGRSPEGVSDGEGNYEISGLAGGSYTLRRRWKAGYLHGEHRENKSVAVKLGDVLEGVDFSVRRGLMISGYVVDKAGDPVEGIRVSCNPLVDNGEGEDVNMVENGTFELRGFSPNVEVHIEVAGRGYSAPRLGPLSTGEEGIEDLQIVVDAGASIAGVVVDQAGKALPDMYVSASPVGGGGSSGGASTEADGTFVMKSLAEGTYSLFARRRSSWSSGERGKMEISLTKGQKLTGVRLVFERTAGSVIAGRVTNAKREPVEQASINAYSPNGGGNAHAQSDADGKYELELDAGGIYTVQAYHQNYTHQIREGVEVGERNLDFVLEGRGTVEGQVLDARTCSPIAQFEIAHQQGLANNVNYQNANYVSFFNEEGRFSVNMLEAGEATIFARATGYAPSLQHVPHVQPNDTTGGVVLRLESGASIEGVVVDMDGRPIAGAQIYLAGRVDQWMIQNAQYGGAGGAAATSDANGEFSIDSLGSELTKITAVHPDFPNTTHNVALAPGQVANVEIVMTGGATIEGTVFANGEPAANQNVYVSGGPTAYHASATTDENGVYRFERVPEGEISVNARVTQDGATRSQGETVSARGGFTTTVDLSVIFGSGVIEGQITANGQSVSGGFVVAILQGAQDGESQSVQGMVTEEGSYTVSGLLPGNYRLMAQSVLAESGQRRMRVVEVAVEDGQTVQRDIELEGGAHIRGVVSGVGNPQRVQVMAITGVIEINDLASDFSMSTNLQSRIGGYSPVNAAGEYDISGLSTGDYTIVALEYTDQGLEGAAFATGHVSVGGADMDGPPLALRKRRGCSYWLTKFRGRDHNPVAALFFGSVERGVCHCQDPVDRVVTGTVCDTDADSDRDIARPGVYGAGRYVVAYPSKTGVLFHVGIKRENQKKFLAPDATNRVVRPQIILQHIRNPTKHIVSGLVPERVVHLLEVVDIAHADSDGSAVALCPGHFTLQPLDNRPTAQKACQSVVGRLVRKDRLALQERLLHLDHTTLNFDSGPKLARVEWFRNIVIRPGVET